MKKILTIILSLTILLSLTSCGNEIKEETKNHKYFLREAEIDAESSFSYIFHLPGDQKREVFLLLAIRP